MKSLQAFFIIIVYVFIGLFVSVVVNWMADYFRLGLLFFTVVLFSIIYFAVIESLNSREQI